MTGPLRIDADPGPVRVITYPGASLTHYSLGWTSSSRSTWGSVLLGAELPIPLPLDVAAVLGLCGSLLTPRLAAEGQALWPAARLVA